MRICIIIFIISIPAFLFSLVDIGIGGLYAGVSDCFSLNADVGIAGIYNNQNGFYCQINNLFEADFLSNVNFYYSPLSLVFGWGANEYTRNFGYFPIIGWSISFSPMYNFSDSSFYWRITGEVNLSIITLQISGGQKVVNPSYGVIGGYLGVGYPIGSIFQYGNCNTKSLL